MNLRTKPRDGHGSRDLRVALVCVAWLAGCASPPPPLQPAPASIDTAILLPERDGRDTALTFTQDGHSTVIAQPYAAARTGRQGPQTFISNAADVEARFGAARAALPARPASFMVFFVEGRDVLTEESRVAVEKVFAEIALRPAPDVLVVGHTDPDQPIDPPRHSARDVAPTAVTAGRGRQRCRTCSMVSINSPRSKCSGARW